MENTSKKTPVSAKAFSEARKSGKTVKELAAHFGISQANCKQIIKSLDLPKRAIAVKYELVNDLASNDVNTTEAKTEVSWSAGTVMN